MNLSKHTLKDLKLFLSSFFIVNVVFLYLTCTFFMGNHDWDWVKGTTQVLSLNTGLFEGRFSKFILNVALFSGQILPILNVFTSFALICLSSVLLVKYFNIKDEISKFLISLTPILSPFVLGWLYFSINIIGNFSALVLSIGGLILLEHKSITQRLIAILFFILSLGIYPSTIETMFILYATKNIISSQKKYYPLMYIIVSAILFKVILFLLTKMGYIYEEHYNIKLNTIPSILTQIPSYIKIFFSQFIYTVPFFPKSLKLICLFALVIAFFTTISSKANIFFWVIAFSSTLISIILTKVPEDVAFQPRINFYGLNFLYTSSFAILLNQKKSLKNLSFVLLLFYLYISITQNFYAQKVWEFGKIGELNLVSRITSRIEPQSPPYEQTLILTDTISLRPKYYNDYYDLKSPYVLNRSYIIRHIPSGIFNFYAPKNLFKINSSIESVSPLMYNYIVNTNSIWPSLDSLYIDNKYAIIILTKKGLNNIKTQLPK